VEEMPLPADKAGCGSEAGRVPDRGLLNSITQAYLYSARNSQRCSAWLVRHFAVAGRDV
jgi:hypothetical protein